MKLSTAFWALFSIIVTTNVWGTPVQYSNESVLPAETFLRLSSMHCGNCTLVVRDLIEAGAIGNTMGAVKRTLNNDLNYTFRLALLTVCDHCYRAAHFWEMNILNRPAKNEEIDRWLGSQESKAIVEYFQSNAMNNP